MIVVHRLNNSRSQRILWLLEDGALKLADSGAIVGLVAGSHGAGHLVPAAGTPERLR